MPFIPKTEPDLDIDLEDYINFLLWFLGTPLRCKAFSLPPKPSLMQGEKSFRYENHGNASFCVLYQKFKKLETNIVSSCKTLSTVLEDVRAQVQTQYW